MFRLIPSLHDDRSRPARPSGPTLSRWQRREIFREMALSELRYQNVDDWRRKRLVQYAATLQLSATEAGRLLQEAQKELEQDLRAGVGSPDPVLAYRPAPTGASLPAWVPIGIGLLMMAGALVLNAITVWKP